MLTATALRTVECVTFGPPSPRAAALFTALQGAAPAVGLTWQPHETYHGGADLLVCWGPGALDRVAPMQQQRTAGGHVLACDLAYWSRETKVRVAIDAAHPQAWLLRRPLPADRFAADPPPLGARWNPAGPVILAGVGAKARVQYGAAVIDTWEAAMVRACHARGLPVRYRPKRDGAALPGTTLAPPGPIDQALLGVSLVITWHSNVAVDAIRLGIPVICRDGAAAAVCPSDFDGPAAPLPLSAGVRARFLTHLAWFQWAPAEARALWTWLREMLA